MPETPPVINGVGRGSPPGTINERKTYAARNDERADTRKIAAFSKTFFKWGLFESQV
jgi:hypothetical protein